MLKNIFKFLVAGVGIIVLGVGAMYGVKYFKYRDDPDYKARLEVEKLNKLYAEDSYGGDTPEETLRLFIDALKKGDTDLAAKYFVLDKQQEWREDLAKIKEKGLLKSMIADLEKTRLTKKTEKEAFFTLVNKDNIAEAELIIGENPYSKRWKIYEL